MASQASESVESCPMNPIVPLPERVFTCKYCTRVYRNPQALGGHQNAHKVERALTKWRAQRNHSIPLRFLQHPAMVRRPSYRPVYCLARQVMVNYPQPSFNERPSMNNGGFAISEPSISTGLGFARFASNSQAKIAAARAAGNGSHNDGSEIDLTLRL